ncbi:MAG: hypothetical protein ACRD2Z_01490 [Thermoanaerobaculia bacterium]
MSEAESTYVVCLENGGYAASIEPRKIYRRIPDAEAESDDFIRIVDESGEDYLYPARYFAPINVPDAVDKVFAGTS